MKKKFGSIFEYMVSGTLIIILFLVVLNLNYLEKEYNNYVDYYANITGFGLMGRFNGFLIISALSQLSLLFVMIAMGGLITFEILETFNVCSILPSFRKNAKNLNLLGVAILAVLSIGSFLGILLESIITEKIHFGAGIFVQLIFTIGTLLFLLLFASPVKRAIFGKENKKENVIDAEIKE